MPDYTLLIKVGDGVNSFYEVEIKDGWGRKILLEEGGVFKNKSEVFNWVEKNLPPLYIDRLDKEKINVDKATEEMKKY